jgi:hypothetical protein
MAELNYKGSNIAAALQGLASGLQKGMELREEAKKQEREERKLALEESKLEADRSAEATKQSFEMEKYLTAKRLDHPTTKQTIESTINFQKGRAAPANKAGDDVLLSAFANMKDPQLKVGPGQSERLNSFFTASDNPFVKALANWTKLSPSVKNQMRQEVKVEMGRLNKIQMELQETHVDSGIRADSERFGIDPGVIVTPIFLQDSGIVFGKEKPQVEKTKEVEDLGRGFGKSLIEGVKGFGAGIMEPIKDEIREHSIIRIKEPKSKKKIVK